MSHDYEIEQEVLQLAMTDVFKAAEAVFEARPDFREFTVKIEGDDIRIHLPDGSRHALPLPAELAD